MKRIAVLLLVLVFGLVLALPALADVIFEPEDDYFKKHREECSYVNRNYYSDGEGGSVTFYRAPDSKKEAATVPNGELFHVDFVWNGDGSGAWALAYNHNAKGEGKVGWAPMTQLRVQYDAESFREEFGGEIRETEEALKLGDCPKLRRWPYPCAAAPTGTFEWNSNWSAPEEPLVFNNVYEDPSGLRWGYVGYLYGARDFWVCLSAPDAEDPWAALGAARPADPGEASRPAPAPDPVPTVVPSPQTEETAPWLPAGLVAGAVVIAGALLAVFRKRSRNG